MRCRPFAVLALLGLLVGFATDAQAQDRPADFGRWWVRNHPFFLTGSHFNAEIFEMSEYLDGNFNLFLTSGTGLLNGVYNFPIETPIWIGANQIELTPESIAFLESVAATPGITGWYVRDEPGYQLFAPVGQVATWIEEHYPETITFCVAFPDTAKAAQMWGDDSNPDYTYTQYINDLVDIIDPDVVAYDNYPFNKTTNHYDRYFDNLMVIRNKAQSLGKPYLATLQSYAAFSVRMPSESDLRMQAFSYLAAGYDALGYFTYDHIANGAIIDPDGNPTPIYDVVQAVNREVYNLGYSTRFLTSTDVRFIPGRTSDQRNPTPMGLSNWRPGAGNDSHIKRIGVNHTNPGSDGADKDGLIGLLKDDEGQVYFFLMNLYHQDDTSATDTALDFVIDFDSTIDELHMLSRQTGMEEVVPLTDHVLHVTLPGGTGNLYKYNTGGFPPGPRPTTPPTIATPPAPASIATGGATQLTVTATGGGTFMYQWQKDGVRLGYTAHYAGVRSTALTIRDADATVVGDYNCVVTNEAGSTNSATAAVTLGGEAAPDAPAEEIPTPPPASPRMIRQPQPVTVGPTGSARFTVTVASEGDVKYRWLKDGVVLMNGEDITGADSASLRVDNLDAFNTGGYRCRISNAGGTVTSEAATLTLIQNAPAD